MKVGRLTRDLAHNKRMAGRPRAVTRELLEEGLRMLAAGMTVLTMCERLGVHHRSWYRAVQPRSKPRVRRHKQALSREVLRTMRRLRRQGLTLAAIAERLGLHTNTVHKHLRGARRARRGTPPHPM
jgi:gp16 family phage-associated protein